jgi:hypothetical protein
VKLGVTALGEAAPLALPVHSAIPVQSEAANSSPSRFLREILCTTPAEG